MIHAANETEALQPKKQFMKPVMKLIDKYYHAIKPPHPGYESYLMEARGGLYWKEIDNTTKNTCSNGFVMLLALLLYKATHEKNILIPQYCCTIG